MIDPKELLAGVDPATAALLEPMILSFYVGAVEGAGEDLRRAVEALSAEEARLMLGYAVIYGAKCAVMAKSTKDILGDLTDSIRGLS